MLFLETKSFLSQYFWTLNFLGPAFILYFVFNIFVTHKQNFWAPKLFYQHSTWNTNDFGINILFWKKKW